MATAAPSGIKYRLWKYGNRFRDSHTPTTSTATGLSPQPGRIGGRILRARSLPTILIIANRIASSSKSNCRLRAANQRSLAGSVKSSIAQDHPGTDSGKSAFPNAYLKEQYIANAPIDLDEYRDVGIATDISRAAAGRGFEGAPEACGFVGTYSSFGPQAILDE